MSVEQRQSQLWTETPLIFSSHLSTRLGRDEYAVYLKLENLQPSHSFKYRGVSHFIQRALATHGSTLHVVCASGGNAGLAAACASQALGVPCTIYLPIDVLVPAYDHPTLWEGHASMIAEIRTQLPRGVKPAAVFCSGCRNAGWDDVPVVALETHGSACFYHSVAANRAPTNDGPAGVTLRMDNTHDVRVAHVAELKSKATSLGASEPSAGVVRAALDRAGGVKCVTVSDEVTMQLAGAFADDHKFLVELACSATLVSAYKPELMARLVPPAAAEKKTLVFIVCGGFKISQQDLVEAGGKWDAMIDGEKLQLDTTI
ncbi:tryptophan synthase beta subunit-like PLP-dependent enzyme [Lactarius quietus]|nr:tryptophan synthase beta subunit-like PLP-dependent enzyme [Lactarius quietus]